MALLAIWDAVCCDDTAEWWSSSSSSSDCTSVQEIMMHFYGFSVFLLWCSFSDKDYVSSMAPPKNSDLPPGRWDEVGCHFLPGASGATRVGKSFFFFACFRPLPPNWFMPLDERQDWAMGKRMQRVQPHTIHTGRKKRNQRNWGRIKIYAFSLICKALLQAKDEEGRREELVCAFPFPLHCQRVEWVGWLVGGGEFQAVVAVRRSTCLAYCRIA